MYNGAFDTLVSISATGVFCVMFKYKNSEALKLNDWNVVLKTTIACSAKFCNINGRSQLELIKGDMRDAGQEKKR